MASDNINQVGKYVKQTRKKADYALGRYKPDVPRIERIRDVFDPANEFSMTFDIKPGEETVLLDLNFNKPPPTGGCNSDCTISTCEQFDVGAGNHFITLAHEYDSGSIRVYDNLIAVDGTKVDESDQGAGQIFVQEITGEGTVVVCYTYSDPGCDFPDVFPTCPELDILHASQHVGLTPIFVDRFDRSIIDSDEPTNSPKQSSGGCGYWTGSMAGSSSGSTSGAFLSGAVAHLENDRVAGDQWEIIQAGEIFNNHPSLEISTTGATGYGVSVSYSSSNHKLIIGASYRYHFQQGDGFGGLLPGPENTRVGFGVDSKETSFFKLDEWFISGVTSVKYYMRLSSVNPGGYYFKIWKQDEPEPTFFDTSFTIIDVTPLFNQFDKEIAFGGLLNATFTPGGGIVQSIAIWGTPGEGHGDPITDVPPTDGINGWTIQWCRAAPEDGFVRFGFCSPPGTASTVTVFQGGGIPTDTAWFSWPSFVDGPGLVESGSSNTLRQAFTGKPDVVRIKGQVRASTFVDRSWGVTFQSYGLGQPSQSGERFSGTTIGGITTGGNDSWTDFDIIAPAYEGADGVRYIHWGAVLTNSPDSTVATLPRYEPPFLFANNAPIQATVRDIEYLPYGSLDCQTGNFCPDSPADFDSRCGQLFNAGINLPYFCNPIGTLTSHDEDELILDGDGNQVFIQRSQGIDVNTTLGETTFFWRQAGVTDDLSDGRCRRQSTQTLNGITTAGQADIWIKFPTPNDCAIHTNTYLELFMPKIPEPWTDGFDLFPNIEIDIGGQDNGPLMEIFQYWTGTAASHTYHQDLGFVSAGDNNSYPGPLYTNSWTAIRMTTEGGRFKVKFWEVGTTEPSAWTYDLPGNGTNIKSFGFFVDIGNYPDDTIVFKYRNLTSSATSEIPASYNGGSNGGSGNPSPIPPPPSGSGAGSPGSGSGSSGGSNNSPLPPVSPVISGNIAQFSAGGSASSFANLASNNSIDTIEMAGGTYHFRGCNLPTRTRPIIIRPAFGENVVFNAAGDGDYGDHAFGLSGVNNYTFDGSAGSMTFQHYLLAQDGVFLLISSSYLTFRNLNFHNIAANSISNGQSSHLFYVSHGNHHLTFSSLTASLMRTGDEPGATAGANGIHVYTAGSTPYVHDVTISNVHISNAGWGIVLRDNAYNISVDGLITNDCGHGVPAAVDFGSGNTGTFRNSRSSSSSGTALIQGSMTDAGGNGPWT